MITIRIFGIACLLLLTSCFGPSEPVHIVGKTMGTIYNVKYRHEDGIPAKEAVAMEIEKLLKHLNAKLSTYITDSEISRFNRDGRIGKWVAIGPELHFVARHALEIAGKTNGAFDPTLGPLVNLWGFGPQGEKKVPENKEIVQRLKRVGYQKLELADGKIKRLVKGMYLDLSASAKGYAVDRIAKLLSSFHATDYMVEIGGEVLVSGNWNIGIESPGDSKIPGKSLEKMLKLSKGALASSGSYRNYFQSGGKKYSHIISRDSGRPIKNDLVAVTVYDPASCMHADALATALMAMGFEKASRFAKQNKVAAWLIRRDGTAVGSDAFLEYFGK